MKRLAIAILGASILTGCSESVRLRVTYAPTGDAATDILVQRRSPVNRWEKITNPVGASYHPHRVAESHWIDKISEGWHKSRSGDRANAVTSTTKRTYAAGDR